MKILDVNKVEKGQVLGRTVFDLDGNIIVPSGTALSSDQLHEIRKTGLNRIYLFDEESFSFIPSERLRDYVRTVIHLMTALEINPEFVKTDTTKLFSQKIVRDKIKVSAKWLYVHSSEKKRKLLTSLYKSAINNHQDYFIALPDNNFGEEDVDYILDVMMVCGAIASEMDFSESEIIQILNSALLHSLGLHIYAELENKNFNSLAPDIKALFHEYPVYSYLMVKGCDPSSFVTQKLLLFHHKRNNGSGIPNGISKLKANEFSRFDQARDVLLIAVEYFELIHGRFGKEKSDPLNAITQLYALGEEVFNLSVLNILRRLLQVFPEGSFVRIRSNSTGRYVGFSGIIRKLENTGEAVEIKSILLTKNALGEEIEPKLVDVSDERHLLFE